MQRPKPRSSDGSASSHEEGTRAFALDDDVPAAVKRRRRNALMARQKRIVARGGGARIGTEAAVLIDGPSEEHGLVLQGRLEGQAPDIDSMVYLTDCDPTAYQAGELIPARMGRGARLRSGRGADRLSGEAGGVGRTSIGGVRYSLCYIHGWQLRVRVPEWACAHFFFLGDAFLRPRARTVGERVRAAAERVARSYGLEIFDVQLRRESIGTVLRVIIDRPIAACPRRSEEAVGIDDASASATI